MFLEPGPAKMVKEKGPTGFKDRGFLKELVVNYSLISFYRVFFWHRSFMMRTLSLVIIQCTWSNPSLLASPVSRISLNEQISAYFSNKIIPSGINNSILQFPYGTSLPS